MFNSTSELDINAESILLLLWRAIDLVKINRTDNIVKVTKKWHGFRLIKSGSIIRKWFLVAVEWIDFENKENSTNQDNAIKFSSAVFSGMFKDNINLKWENEN
jgi:hypothetical protein